MRIWKTPRNEKVVLLHADRLRRSILTALSLNIETLPGLQVVQTTGSFCFYTVSSISIFAVIFGFTLMSSELVSADTFEKDNDVYTEKRSITERVLTTTARTTATTAAVVASGQAAAGALVPVAMKTFGTVVSGVGTLHASAAAGGVAATLQSIAAASVLGPATLTVGRSHGSLYLRMVQCAT